MRLRWPATAIRSASRRTSTAWRPAACCSNAAYVQAVCCNPSRSSFLSGLRPETTNVHTNSDPMPECLPPGTKTLPTYFKERGFYLANIGKLFHGGFEGDHLRCFDRLEFAPKPEGWEGPGPIVSFPPVQKEAGAEKPPRKGDPGYEKWRRARSDRYGDSGLTEEEEGDYRYSVTAAALLKEFAREKRQFFLSVGSHRPHTPLIAPKKYVDLYDPAQIPAPQAPPEKDQGVPDVARKFGRSSDIFMAKPATPQQAREAVAAYYACVTMVDACIGRILDTLEQEGLADKTIVVFLGDHGFHLGEHGLWSKYTLFEQSRRAPLIVRVPGVRAMARCANSLSSSSTSCPRSASCPGSTCRRTSKAPASLPSWTSPIVPGRRRPSPSSQPTRQSTGPW